MNVIYDDALIEYMKNKGKENVLVEVASSNTSDFDVSELYLRFVPDKFADSLIATKHYRSVEAPVGRLLLPPYHMHIEETIELSLHSFLMIKWIKQKGLKL